MALRTIVAELIEELRALDEQVHVMDRHIDLVIQAN